MNTLETKVIDQLLCGGSAGVNEVFDDGTDILESCFGAVLMERIKDDEFTELMINSNRGTYIEVNGALKDLNLCLDPKDISKFIDKVSQINSRNIDFLHPIFDGKLRGGYRCNIVVPPVSLSGPLLTIRKHLNRIDNFESLICSGMLSSSMFNTMKYSLLNKKNIIICGGTGTGKTTLVNILFNSLLDSGVEERIVTIEDTAELNIKLKHVIKLESRFPTPDCPFEIKIRDLVKTALRMRPDRIIVGEVRGEEAYDLLHAINTGHKGTVCTIHANSCRDALRRLETLAILGHPNLSVNVARTWIASNVDVVVYLERQGSIRKVSSIQRLIGAEAENYVLEEII
ncbi:MAG TPA: ATPase, T2SS/T4P/T4SS family [bacterium]|nr:ATPase, T2SS/T4P/T4SS family [bacterium]